MNDELFFENEINDKNLFIFKNEIDALNFLKKESSENLFCEICGFLGYKENSFIVKIVKNRSKDPHVYFLIEPYDYLNFLNNYECLAIFHSHLQGSEDPSEFDIKTSENCCYPFLIYSIITKKFFLYEPTFKDYDVNKIERLKELL
jgi:proteasome lid subunit RPN8/RPN11